MNNNQFKRFIREQIELGCKENSLTTIYIDTTTTTRIYYVYDENYAIKGTISNWLGNDSVSMKYSLSKEKVVSLCNKEVELQGNYLNLDEFVKFIKNILHIMKEGKSL